MDNILILATVIMPVVTAVVEVVKRTLHLNTRYAPVTALVIGVGIGAIASPFSDAALVERLWAGGLAGFAAMGLFDLGKSGKIK